MKFKPLSILLVGMMLIASISAQAFSFIVRYSNGNSANYDSENVSEIKFSPEGVVAISLNDGSVIELESQVFAALFFNETENGVQDFATEQLQFAIHDNILSLNDYEATLEITSVSGATVAKGKGSVSVAELPTGVYIVKSGNKSAKIALK